MTLYGRQSKKIIFVFLVLTLVSSSLSAAAFVTGNLAFAKKSSSDSGGGGDKGGGGSGGSSDNGGGGSSTDNTGGGGSDNTNAGSGGGDTGSSTITPPPPSTDENTPPPPAENKQQTVTCPDGSTADSIDNCPAPPDNSGGGGTTNTPPAAENQQQQTPCPGGSTPDDNGNCPASADSTTTPAPVDCTANPTDPSCTNNTTPPAPVDCTANPTDPSCTNTAANTLAPVDCTANPTDPSCTNTAATTPSVKCAADEYLQSSVGVCFSAKVVDPVTHQCGVAGYHKISEGSCESDDTPLPGGGCVAGLHEHTSDLGIKQCFSKEFIDKPPGGECPEDHHLADWDNNLCIFNSKTSQGRCATGWHYVDVISKNECTRDTTTSKDVGDTVIDIGQPSTAGVCETHGSTKVGDRCVIDAVDIGPISSSGICSSGTRVGDRCMIVPESNVLANQQDGSCPIGYHTSALPTTETGGYKTCDHNIITQASMPTTQTGNAGGMTTNMGGATTTTTPELPAELEVPPTSGGSCPPGTHGGGTPTTVHCLAQKTADGSFILPSLPQSPGSKCDIGYIPVSGKCLADIFCPQGMTKLREQCISNKLLPATTTTTALPAQTGNADNGGTTTNMGAATSTTTTPTTPTTQTTTSTTTNVINRGSSSGAGGGGTATTTTTNAAPSQPSSTQTANNGVLTYVNAVNKISIKYPSTWTKTEFTGNPKIPVMFNAPITTATTTPGAKTNFVISITPGAADLDSFAQQQINALTQSNTVKYTLTDPNAKVLTPPTGVTAFREISYDGMKNSNGVQVPLQGAAIFFVNGGTGYSLLYLAKQTEYTQNIPMIQQMVNSFQIGAPSASGGAGPVQNVAASSSAR